MRQRSQCGRRPRAFTAVSVKRGINRIAAVLSGETHGEKRSVLYHAANLSSSFVLLFSADCMQRKDGAEYRYPRGQY